MTRRLLHSPRSFLPVSLAVLSLACGGGGEPAERTGGTQPDGAPADGGAELPEMVMIREPGLHPEGIEWDGAHDRFLVGSMTRGTITAVSDDGTPATLVADTSLGASVGIHVDERRSRLLVAYADPGVFAGETEGFARLGVYALGTGERLHLVELGPLTPGKHFANDASADGEGNAYVTDSFAPAIYRVTPDGAASVFARDDRLAAEGVGLNGVDWHPDGFLIAAVMGSGKLFKVPLADPSRISEVRLEEPFSADGIDFRPDGRLAAVAYFPTGAEEARSEVLLLDSEDGWASARIVARADMQRWQPTTVAVREGAVYAVSAHLAEMFGGEGEPVQAFEIVRVEFEQASGGA